MPASGEFLDGVAHYLVTGGVASGIYSTSGVSVQVNVRRDFGPELTYVILKATGGAAFPFDLKEDQAFQILVDGPTLSGARAKAREVFEALHEQIRLVVSGDHRALWIRALTPPQSIPIGPGAGSVDRFQFALNFDAMLLKD